MAKEKGFAPEPWENKRKRNKNVYRAAGDLTNWVMALAALAEDLD